MRAATAGATPPSAAVTSQAPMSIVTQTCRGRGWG